MALNVMEDQLWADKQEPFPWNEQVGGTHLVCARRKTAVMDSHETNGFPCIF